MLRPWWYATQGAINVPAGLILAAKDGIDLGTDWSVWTDADGKFLRGTDSDSVVATTGSQSYPTRTSNGGGSHNGGSGRPLIYDWGTSRYGASHPRSPSEHTNYVGNHSHTIALTYVPAYEQTRLIQAQNDSPIPVGAIMFGDAANTKQTPYSFNADRLFRANTAVGSGLETKSVGVGSGSDSHSHFSYVSQTAGSIVSYGINTSMGGGGGSHNHGQSSLVVTPSLARCTLRAFDIIDQKNIEGLIGMWAQAGVPDKWELVAAMTDKFLTFSSTGEGGIAGNDTVSFSGSTSSRGHSHSAGGWRTGSNQVCSGCGHTGSVYHSHSFSRSGAPYLPERYHIKFIRYVG